MWVVNVDVMCLNHSGNLLDAMTLAAVAALKNGILWAHTYTCNYFCAVKIPCNDVGMGSSAQDGLPLLAPPFTVSFGLLEYVV